MSLETYGDYQLIKKLATGGMAQIFLARQRGPEGFEKLLVVKRILPHLAENEDFIKMFLDEARIAARLNHPNIVQIFNLGSIDDSFFIAMEYIHGEDVRRVWKRAEAVGQQVPIPLVCRIIMDAASGLDYAHKKTDNAGKPLNIVHRDISPQNILVTFEGGVKVVDFGIAKAADQATVTRSGVLKGKYSYMSPEQASGLKIDHRSDIFALGVVLYELLTGTRLFKRSNDIQTLNAVTECQAAPPSEVNSRLPKSLDPVVLKALARNADDRYRDCLELQAALEDWLLENKLASSSVHLAAFMKDIYAERLKREADEGRVLVEELDSSRNPQVDEAPRGKATPAGHVKAPGHRSKHPALDGATASVKAQPVEVTRVGRTGDGTRGDANSGPRRSEEQVRAREARVTGTGETRAAPDSEQSASVTQHQLGRFPWAIAAALLVGGLGVGGYLSFRPSGAVVRIDSDPSGASVWLDGQPTALITPCALPHGTAGSAALALEKVGYRTLTTTVTWPEEGEVALSAFKLEKESAKPVAVEAEPGDAGVSEPAPSPPPRVPFTARTVPAGALVTVDGQRQGASPVTLELERRASVTFRFTLPGYKELEDQLVVPPEAGEKTWSLEKADRPTAKPPAHPVARPTPESVVSPPARQFGKVRFVIKPWANVVCGEFNFGDTPFEDKQLPVGRYRCTFTNPQLNEKRTQLVEVNPNETTRVQVNFGN